MRTLPLYLAILSFGACVALAFTRPHATWEWIPAIAAFGTFGFIAARRMGREPFANTAPAIALALLVPGYHVIAALNRGRAELAMPGLGLDRAIPLEPAWMLAYGSIWLFAFLPVLVVRGRALTRRTLFAFICVIAVAYAGFVAYPTILPRPDPGPGFFAWTLAINYALDPPLNCFPSLHVAWAFVAALACHRVHGGVGAAAIAWAAMIALSTLFTKQHYVVDVVAGIAMALAAYAAFLRGYPRGEVLEMDRRLAPARALRLVWIYALAVALAWITYQLR